MRASAAGDYLFVVSQTEVRMYQVRFSLYAHTYYNSKKYSTACPPPFFFFPESKQRSHETQIGDSDGSLTQTSSLAAATGIYLCSCYCICAYSCTCICSLLSAACVGLLPATDRAQHSRRR